MAVMITKVAVLPMMALYGLKVLVAFLDSKSSSEDATKLLECKDGRMVAGVRERGDRGDDGRTGRRGQM